MTSKRNGVTNAQIDAPRDYDWGDIIALIERIGPVLVGHIERGEIERPYLNVAFFTRCDRMTASLLMPNEVITAVGRWGFNSEASACLSTDD